MIWPYIAIVAALFFGLTLGVLLMFLLQARAGGAMSCDPPSTFTPRGSPTRFNVD